MVINSSGMEETSQLRKIGGLNRRRPPNAVKNAGILQHLRQKSRRTENAS